MKRTMKKHEIDAIAFVLLILVVAFNCSFPQRSPR